MHLSVWIHTTRPKTLFAALAPVLLGTALACGDGAAHAGAALLCLLGAVAIQIGTNFCNDYFDHRQGADTTERQGPQRGLQTGHITPPQLLAATVLCFALAALVGALLFLRAGSIVLWITLASILSGIFYTAGRHSLAYTGLADLFVLVFFGPVAVAGTYWMQVLPPTLPLHVLLLSFGPGLIATALLTVNNLRDVDEDRRSRKNTLAVRFGRSFSRAEYTTCLLLSLLLPLVTAWTTERGWGAAACLLLLPAALKMIATVRQGRDGAVLNPLLARTGKFLLAHSLLVSFGWVLSA